MLNSVPHVFLASLSVSKVPPLLPAQPRPLQGQVPQLPGCGLQAHLAAPQGAPHQPQGPGEPVGGCKRLHGDPLQVQRRRLGDCESQDLNRRL